VTLDTNILIAHLNGEAAVIEAIVAWKRAGRQLFISSISTAEILALETLTSNETDRIRNFLVENFLSVPFDDDIAEQAAMLRRSYRIELPDAAIAATALDYDVPLVTRDRQFRKIPGLTIVAL